VNKINIVCFFHVLMRQSLDADASVQNEKRGNKELGN